MTEFSIVTALKQPGKERIRDLVKNPLRLTLLCFDWGLKGGKLPETQAELYQRFVDRIYEWKAEEFPTTPEQRQGLNKALAQLSLAAIDDRDPEGEARFRLRHGFVQSFLTGELFGLALQLGWLNQVGVDADDPAQKVYAFYHPIFEEYFAASGIDDWDFFLPRQHRNQPIKDKPYRIFEPQWEEVILLWLGQSEETKDSPKRQRKEDFIDALIGFKDGCGRWLNKRQVGKGFYEFQAYFLVAKGIAEFRNYSRADDIVKQIVRWSFGNLNEKQELQKFLDPIALRAKAVLQKTDPKKAIAFLEKLIVNSSYQDVHKDVIQALGAIKSESAINPLINVLANSSYQDVRISAAEALGEIGSQVATDSLINALSSSKDPSFLVMRSAAKALGKIGSKNAINHLAKFLGSLF